MIYIVEEFYDSKWWTSSAHPTRAGAEMAIRDILLPLFIDANKFRIREFKLPDD